MIVRTLGDITGTGRDMMAENGHWRSRRLLLAGDRTGFSMHDTLIFAGTETFIHYAHHLEAVYCVRGEGEIEDMESGKIHPIADGTLYVLDGHERHYLRARTEMRMVCVFTPPVVGPEMHDEHGVYPLMTLDDLPAEEKGER